MSEFGEGVLGPRVGEQRGISRRTLLKGAAVAAGGAAFAGLFKNRLDRLHQLATREFDGKLREEGAFKAKITGFDYQGEHYKPVFRRDPEVKAKNELSPAEIKELGLGEGEFVTHKVYGGNVPGREPLLESDHDRYWGWAKIEGVNSDSVYVADNFVSYQDKIQPQK